MKLVAQKNSTEEEDHVDWFVQKVRSEVRALEKHSNYDLSKFPYAWSVCGMQYQQISFASRHTYAMENQRVVSLS